jgi:hypothetical protein
MRMRRRKRKMMLKSRELRTGKAMIVEQELEELVVLENCLVLSCKYVQEGFQYVVMLCY